VAQQRIAVLDSVNVRAILTRGRCRPPGECGDRIVQFFDDADQVD
jgi:hypothetical protein